jgi:hypothetical protein
MNSKVMDMVRSGGKTSTPMDGKGYVRPSRRGEVIQHANDGPVVPLMLMRRTGGISSKYHGRWSMVRRRPILKAASNNDFVNLAGLEKFQMTVRSVTNINSKVGTDRSLRSKHKILLKIRNNGVQNIIRSTKNKAVININLDNTILHNEKTRVMLTLAETKSQKRGANSVKPIITGLTQSINVLFDT